jgi:hypothetical protein
VNKDGNPLQGTLSIYDFVMRNFSLKIWDREQTPPEQREYITRRPVHDFPIQFLFPTTFSFPNAFLRAPIPITSVELEIIIDAC